MKYFSVVIIILILGHLLMAGALASFAYLLLNYPIISLLLVGIYVFKKRVFDMLLIKHYIVYQEPQLLTI